MHGDAPSARLLGGYELVRLLARGGMAEVYEARRIGARGFSKRVAMKRILPQFLHDERLVRMFCYEATTLAALDHPNLVQVVDFGEHEGEPYMVLEYIEGISCADLISGVAARNRTVELGAALHIAAEVLDALQYVHAARSERGLPLGIVHRDVAPANILLGRSGEVKLADFGIVRGELIPSHTQPGELKGKVGYVSPEQAMGGTVDPRSDLFSLAVVFAELCIARPLFDGPSDLHILSSLCAGDLRALDAHGRHLPRAVHTLLRRSLSLDPNERHASAAEFKADVERAMRENDAIIGAHGVAAYLQDLGLVRVRSTIRPSTPRRAWRAEPDLPDGMRPTVPDQIRVTIVDGSTAPPAVSEPEITYRIRRASGTIVGPLPLSVLLEMVATGRVGVDTFVSRNGGPFIAVASLHELSRLASRPAFRFFDPLDLQATERRSIDRTSLARYLYAACEQQRTGLICARSEAVQVRLYVSDGAVVFSASTYPEHLLGALLATRGKVAASDIAHALEAGWRARTQLGTSLVARGLLGELELSSLLSEQLRRRLGSLLALHAGELFFVAGAPCGETPVAPDAHPLFCITRAVLDSYGADEIAAILQRAWAVPLRPTPAFGSLRDRLGLPPAELRGLERVVNRSLADVLGPTPDTERALDRVVLRAAFIGVSSGALRFRRFP